jgi:hypothetical protein
MCFASVSVISLCRGSDRPTLVDGSKDRISSERFARPRAGLTSGSPPDSGGRSGTSGGSQPPVCSARLARELPASLDALSDSEIEQQWLDEAERRLAQLDSGDASADPPDIVLARVRARRG